MTVLRFAFVGLCVLGVAACLFATARLLGFVPKGQLALYPPWMAVHFAAGIAFVVLAPLQFWTRLRQRQPRLHRLMGRTAVAAGVLMAVTGLVIAHTAPDRPMSERIFMTVFSTAYVAFLALGVRAALGRNFEAHRTWMVLMMATALTPMTQRVVFPVLMVTIGDVAPFWELFTSAAWVAWCLNMAVAEGLLLSWSNARRKPA